MADAAAPANAGDGSGPVAAFKDKISQLRSALKALEEEVDMMNQLFSDERAAHMDLIMRLLNKIKLQASRIKELEGVDGARQNDTDGGASATKVDTKEESKEGLKKEPEEDG